MLTTGPEDPWPRMNLCRILIPSDSAEIDGSIERTRVDERTHSRRESVFSTNGRQV